MTTGTVEIVGGGTVEIVNDGNTVEIVGGGTVEISTETYIGDGDKGAIRISGGVWHFEKTNGAPGNGTSDDAPYLNEMLDAGKTVVLSDSKQYLIGSRLEITADGTGIIGNGATVLMSMASGDFDNTVFDNRNGTSGTAVYASGVDDPFVRDVKIRPTAWTDQRYLRAVYFDTCNRPRIIGSDFRDFSRGSGVVGIKDCIDPSIRHNVFEDIYSKSIYEADGVTEVTDSTAQITAIEIDDGSITGSKNLDICHNTARRMSHSAALIALLGNPQCDFINVKGSNGRSRHGVIAFNYAEDIIGEFIDNFGWDIDIFKNRGLRIFTRGIKIIHGAARTSIIGNSLTDIGLSGMVFSGSTVATLTLPADGNQAFDNIITRIDPKVDWTEADGTVIFDSESGTKSYYVDGDPDTTVGIEFAVPAGATSLITNALIERNIIDLGGTGQRAIFHENTVGASTSNVIGPNIVRNVAAGGRKIQDTGKFLQIDRQKIERYELAAGIDLVSDTSAQDIFDVNYSGEIGEEVRFRGCMFVTGLSAVLSTFSFGIAGTASITDVLGLTRGKKGGGVGTTQTTEFSNGTAKVVTTATTSTAGQLEWEFTLTFTTAGTIVAQITMNDASAATISAKSWQTVERISRQANTGGFV